MRVIEGCSTAWALVIEVGLGMCTVEVMFGPFNAASNRALCDAEGFTSALGFEPAATVCISAVLSPLDSASAVQNKRAA